MFYYKEETSADAKSPQKVYTLNKENSTIATPAKFSVEDKFSDERIKIKQRFKIFPFDE